MEKENESKPNAFSGVLSTEAPQSKSKKSGGNSKLSHDAKDGNQKLDASPELDEEEESGKPVQIISINADGVRFDLHEERLQEVLARVPAGTKVSMYTG